MLNDKEKRVLEETHLRNLKRRYAKLIQHADLTDEALEVKKEIDFLEDKI